MIAVNLLQCLLGLLLFQAIYPAGGRFEPTSAFARMRACMVAVMACGVVWLVFYGRMSPLPFRQAHLLRRRPSQPAVQNCTRSAMCIALQPPPPPQLQCTYTLTHPSVTPPQVPVAPAYPGCRHDDLGNWPHVQQHQPAGRSCRAAPCAAGKLAAADAWRAPALREVGG